MNCAIFLPGLGVRTLRANAELKNKVNLRSSIWRAAQIALKSSYFLVKHDINPLVVVTSLAKKVGPVRQSKPTLAGLPQCHSLTEYLLYECLKC